ncbi:MAG: glycosyltransferase [Saprospiraceae bacterium]|nr:glycosyltransferase [Saprospiraceae bacterium]
MRLSVIIVNYNVRHFLEQALLSVRRAVRGIESEVWVVDNNSVDDSVRMVREKFPEVRLLANKDNPGFAVANNQAIRQSTGAYILLLNPDTLVEEDTFHKCLDFMEAHPEAGALGVKLIDGSGKFLPESKRGFPSPWVAFCKTFGLSALFPKSRLFNYYHLGHRGEDETCEVDVLAGAFMFMRRAALDKAGLLDEAFFMYGEDIDLSYRIVQAGYRNYYFPETKIIHYKGESTKKGSLNYVRTFYQAMIIFTRKHFTGRRAGLFIIMLQGAIWLRAGMTLLKNIWSKIRLPLLDALLIYGGLVFLKDFWANYYYKEPDWFKTNVLWFNFPLYILIWLGAVWLNGGYDQRYDLRRLVRGLGIGTLILAAVYGFLDLDYRPSRALVLMGAVWAALATVGVRALTHFIEFRNFRIGRDRVKNLAIVGSAGESARVMGLLNQAGVAKNLIGRVSPTPALNEAREGEGDALDASAASFSKVSEEGALGEVSQLDEIVRIYRVDEVIFCSKNMLAQDIMSWMTRLGPSVAYKIVPEESLSIIGSSSKNEPGELYTIEIRYNIAQPGQRRNKRVFDLMLCGALLVTLPLWLVFSGHRGSFFKNWWPVLLGKKTWVGYAPFAQHDALPPLKSGVFSPLDELEGLKVSDNAGARLNFLFAKDWNVWRDLDIILHTLK